MSSLTINVFLSLLDKLQSHNPSIQVLYCNFGDYFMSEEGLGPQKSHVEVINVHGSIYLVHGLCFFLFFLTLGAVQHLVFNCFWMCVLLQMLFFFSFL